MFSVIIPLYNKEKSIEATIKSVLNQTFKTFELIIINDGSTDNSLQVVNKIIDDRIVIIDKRNGGVSSARNQGIKNSKFSWIAFLDGDDLWYPDFLHTISSSIIENSKTLIVAPGFELVDKSGTVVQKRCVIENMYCNYFEAINSVGISIVHSSSICINKQCFLEVGYFNEQLTHGEDIEMWERLGKKYKFLFVSKVVSRYMQDTENRSVQNKPDLKRTRLYNIDLGKISNECEESYYKDAILRFIYTSATSLELNRSLTMYKRFRILLTNRDIIKYLYKQITKKF